MHKLLKFLPVVLAFAVLFSCVEKEPPVPEDPTETQDPQGPEDPPEEPPVEIPEGGIVDAEALRAFLANPSGEVFLMNDIDLQGESVSAASFDGVFDGKGHTISNPGAPLFTANSGTLKDFTVAGTFEPAVDVFSPVVLQNTGSIEGVTNKASVSINRTSAATGSVVIGGIAAYSSVVRLLSEES